MPRPRILAVAAAAAALHACAAVSRPPATVASLLVDADAERARYAATQDTVVERLARRVVARGDRTLDVLLLSGGGQHGAYGAGFLRGWRTRADAPMPRFDLVTGISTGSLQAPFALLGTGPALDTLAALYREAADRAAPSIDWWFWLRRTGGVLDTRRFVRSVRGVLDERMRDALRAELRAGRQILVGTTDLDLGTGRVWDLGREMDSTAAGLDRARTLLVASSAIPGIFPPLVIDGHVHGDGGVISNVLPGLDAAHYRRLAERLRARGVTGPVTVRLWAVMNLWTQAAPKVVNPAGRRGITQRSNTLLFWAQQPQVVERLALLARAVSADVPGLRVEMRYTAVPSPLATAPGADKLFDRAWAERLERIGYERARGAAPWDTVTTPYAR